MRPPPLRLAVEAANIWASLEEMTISETGRGREVRGMDDGAGGAVEMGAGAGTGVGEEEESVEGLTAVPRRRNRLAFSRGPASLRRKEERRRLLVEAKCSDATEESAVEVETEERR